MQWLFVSVGILTELFVCQFMSVVGLTEEFSYDNIWL